MRGLATWAIWTGLAAGFAPAASYAAKRPPFYPDRAARVEMPGAVTLSCQVNANGTLRDCVVVSEEPKDYGFGEAAIRMSAEFRMRPKSSDGQPVEGGTVRIPIIFKVPGSDKKPDAGQAGKAPPP